MANKIIIRSPKGFRVKYRFYYYDKVLETVYCDLIDNSKPNEPSVGHVELERTEGRNFVTHSQLYSEYHGKGFGNLLYAKAIAWAINNGYRVRSSGDSSSMAKRVWNGKGLRKIFTVRKYTDNLGGVSRETWYPTRKRSGKAKKK